MAYPLSYVTSGWCTETKLSNYSVYTAATPLLFAPFCAHIGLDPRSVVLLFAAYARGGHYCWSHSTAFNTGFSISCLLIVSTASSLYTRPASDPTTYSRGLMYPHSRESIARENSVRKEDSNSLSNYLLCWTLEDEPGRSAYIDQNM